MNSTERHDKDIGLLIENVRSIDSIHGSWGCEKSVSFTVGDLDHYSVYLMTTGTAGVTATLPSAATNIYRTLTFVKIDTGAGTGAITDLGGTWTTLYLINKGDALTLQSDGAIWQVRSGQVQPVAGEPSLGTPHPHVYNWTDLGATGIGTYTFTVPAAVLATGAKAIWVWLEQRNSGVNGKCSVQDMSGNQYASAIGTVLNTWATCGCIVPIDSSGQFQVVISTAAVFACLVGMDFYWV